MSKYFILVSLIGVFIIGGISMAFAKDVLKSNDWDKTFKKDENVNIEKVTFKNRYGIELVGDLYTPKDIKKDKKYPAIAISGPFGAVKE